MADSAELELLVSSKLAWIPNGQPLLGLPLSDGFDMLLSRPVTTLALNTRISLLNDFGQSVSLACHVAAETFLPLFLRQPLGHTVMSVLDRLLFSTSRDIKGIDSLVPAHPTLAILAGCGSTDKGNPLSSGPERPNQLKPLF